MKVFDGIESLVGGTPLFQARRLSDSEKLKAKLLVKLEYLNPAGSVKDRAAKFMIDDAEKKGLISSGATIIEPTSGNTGIGIAAIGVPKGYKVVLTMPETMSVERRKLLAAYGAEIILTDGKKGMRGAVEKAEELHRITPNSIILSQFDNSSNPAAHYYSTGPEIWDDTDGRIDAFVACVGTGGTLSGVGKFLKEKNQAIKIFAVEPSSSPLLSKGKAGAHNIQGIGANFIPKNFDRAVCDEIIAVSDEEAFEMTKTFVKKEGILVGISSGACLAAAIKLAKTEEFAGKTIVALLPDTGDRYLSMDLFK